MSSTAIRYFLYARKSTDRDDHQVKSIEDQIAVLETLASRLGIRIVKRFSEAVSAKKPHMRPKFAQMLAAIERGEASGILVWHVNRLFRNPHDSGLVQQLLQDGTIEAIQTPERAYYPEDNALLLAVESGMANQYVRDLRRDVERGVKEKAARGWWPYAPKVGYHVNELTKDVEPKLGDFELLRQAWELMATGDYTVPKVGAELFSWGLRVKATRTKPARALSRSSLYRMFRDPFYAGEFRYRGHFVVGRHQPMVSKTQFELVQRILNRKGSTAARQVFPYTKLIRCGICGCAITAETKVKRYTKTGRSRSYTYYHCTGYKGCARHSVGADYLEQEIGAFVHSCQVRPDVVDWARSVIQEASTVAGRPSTSAESQHSLERNLESRLEAVYEMREAREISAEDFQARKRRYEAELGSLHEDTRKLHVHRAIRQTELLRKIESLPTINTFDIGDPAEKNAAAKALGTYSLTLGKLEIVPDPLFDRIRTFEPPRSGPDQLGDDPNDPDSSAWRALRDSLLSLVNDDDAQIPE